MLDGPFKFRIPRSAVLPYIPAMESVEEANLKPRPFWQHIAIGIGLLLAAWFVVPMDIFIAENASSKSWPGDLRRIIKLSEIFAHGFGVALIVGGIWCLAAEKRKYLPRLIACVAFPPITAHLVKLLIARRRPTAYLDHWLQPHYPDVSAQTWVGFWQQNAPNVEYATQAFPSAHAALVCGLTIGLAYVFPKGRMLFLFVATLACIQRITFLAHWTSDVMVGASLGFLIAGGLVQNWGIGYFCGRFEKRTEDESLKIFEAADQRAA